MFSPVILVKMRKARGLSQEQLARNSGLATVTVSKLEAGTSADPKASTLLKLSTALDCSIEAFFPAKSTDHTD